MVHVRDMPGLDVGEGPRADLAVADQVTEGGDRLLPGRVGIDAMDVIDIDAVGLQPLATGVYRLHEMAPRQAAIGYMWPHLLRDLGCQHPTLALGPNGRSDHALRASLSIDIGRIDEVDAVVDGMVDDAPRFVRIGGPAEHHGAEADLRDLDPAGTQHPIAHLCHEPSLLAAFNGCDLQACAARRPSAPRAQAHSIPPFELFCAMPSYWVARTVRKRIQRPSRPIPRDGEGVMRVARGAGDRVPA